MAIKPRILLFLICIVFTFKALGQDTLYMANYGVLPNTREDVNDRINSIIHNLADKHLVLKFEEGRYDFFEKPSSFNIGLILLGKDSLIIDGGGSTFIFHGKMTIAYLHDCRNISLKNFKVDWERPLISQGIIQCIGTDYADVAIDSIQYPYLIRDGKVQFIGTSDLLEVDKESYSTLYNSKTLDIEYLTRDRHLSHDNSLFRGRAESRGKNVVRFYGKVDNIVSKGTILSLYHGHYITPGIVLSESKDLKLQDITLFHALSMGVLAERCENLYFNRVNMLPNHSKNRVFSGLADAFHLVSNKGKIEILNCIHEGQGDDFANVRGVYIPVAQIYKNRNVLDVNFHRSSQRCYFTPGDSIWFVSNSTMQRTVGGKVMEILNKKDGDGNHIGYTIKLDREIQDNITEDFFVENASWNPDLVIRNCHIGKRNRARGLLITTSGKVVVENNYFSTAGTAILIEGDINYWYEAGAIRDLVIRNNVFNNCGTSISSTGSPGEWGEAIITISPSFQPKTENSPAYHQNIRIENNIIRSFDIPLLMARSVDGLYFNNNLILRTYEFNPFAWQKFNIKLDGCKNVNLVDNLYSNDFMRTPVSYSNMNPQQIFER